MQFVFGYGSLAAAPGGLSCALRGWRRLWGVAMDNRLDVPGYKHYLLRSDASRPHVFVAFLDIVECPGAVTNGICVAADGPLLDALDERERNYERVDVTAACEPAVAGAVVWAYRGSAAGRARLDEGRRRGRAVVSREYLQLVRDLAGEQTGDLPVWDLQRVDLPRRSPSR